MHVTLNTIQKVTDFVTIMSKLDDDVNLVSGRFVVDAKSILGILSLDLSKPIKVEHIGDKNQNEISNIISTFE
mgnify:CR=1 FL=1